MKVFLLLIIVSLTFSFARSQNETSILFIGNSLTFSNDMPKMMRNIALVNDKKVYVDTVVKRGKTINFHATRQLTYNKIKSRKWQYVIIQGYSTEFAQPKEVVDRATVPYLRKIIDSVRYYNPCSKILIYETWGYRYGKPELSNAGDYNQMQDQIMKQTLRTAEIFSVGVCPVGEAWRKVINSDSQMELYTKDNYHPTKAGSYIAACTFYTTLFKESAYGSKSNLSLNPSDRKTIETLSATVIIGNRSKWNLTFPVRFPVARFDLILQNNELTLVDRSLFSKKVIWYFGNGESSKEVNPRYIYKKKGTYTVNQVVQGKCGTHNLKRKITVKSVDL